MDPVILKKIRAYIFNNFNEYKKITGNKKFTKNFGEVKGESLTNLPKEFDKEIVNSIETKDKLFGNVLKMKQFYVFKNSEPDIILNENIVVSIISDIKTTYDFTKFLHTASI